MSLTKEDRIKTVYGGGRHVVILGAGASIASTNRNAEAGGKRLPSMDNFIEVVGLQDIVDGLPQQLKAKNFETLYSNLHNDNPNSIEIKEIERRVQEYFKNMKLPEEATIYDYLVLSLRPNDLIATFNWDPFLYQAFWRNKKVADMPYLAAMHGNVALGYSKEDGRSGPSGMTHKKSFSYYEPTKLLYPVTKKNYNDDEFIKGEWERVTAWLHDEDTKLVTIFGYGAPATDVEAMQLLNTAWGSPERRNMEQFEVIDIRSEDEVTASWNGFIHTHHYDYAADYFQSSLAYNPRRTKENYFQHIQPLSPDEAFSESNPVPSDIKSLKELWEWHEPLIATENEWKKNKSA